MVDSQFEVNFQGKR
ncbi:unnamed protein product [Acanthoscelides obtectus]|uniref:Uncharacterized protein n=1 Tax=Acanthoscelides obtectus TaxID=200917 RepID=A0A9P0MG32_ACAOB|nr:unnamed protein product [Acanthoscelides obtectus]